MSDDAVPQASYECTEVGCRPAAGTGMTAADLPMLGFIAVPLVLLLVIIMWPQR